MRVDLSFAVSRPKFGQLFQECDTDGDGRLGRADFDRIMRSMLEGLRAENRDSRSSGGAAAAMETRPSWIADATSGVRPPSTVGGDVRCRTHQAKRISLGVSIVRGGDSLRCCLSVCQTLYDIAMCPGVRPGGQ